MPKTSSKYIIGMLLAIFALVSQIHAQQLASDMSLIQTHGEQIPQKRYRAYTPLTKKSSFLQKINPVQLTLSGLMFFYQNVLSSQFNAGCLYAPSCSEFGKCAIKNHGIVKGMLLTSDRLFRCNRIVAIEIYKNAPNTIGRYADDCKIH